MVALRVQIQDQDQDPDLLVVREHHADRLASKV